MGFWLVWFAIGIAFVVLYSVLLLPRLILKSRSAGFPVCGKAVLREKCGESESIVYEPSASVRPYIRNYRVTRTGGGVWFCGEWAKHAAFVKYEIAVFDAHNNIIELLTVKEKFNSGNNTAEVRLPAATDMVSVRILCVDDVPQRSTRLPLNAPYLIWTLLLCVSLAIMIDVLLWVSITFLCGCLDKFTSTLVLPPSAWGVLFGVTTPVVLVISVLFTIVRHILFNVGRKHE